MANWSWPNKVAGLSDTEATTDRFGLPEHRLVTAQEDLRKRLAEQFHGRIQNRLSVAATWLRMARESIEYGYGNVAARLADAEDLLHYINRNDLGAVVKELSPPLIRSSLEGTIMAMVDEFRTDIEISVHVSGAGDTTPEMWRRGLPEALRLTIYRVAEEAMNNVLKHSMATTFDIELDSPANETVVLRIRDNGLGFSVPNTSPGFGIHTMRDYCIAAGGSLQISSEVGRGTTVTVSFNQVAE